jgi:hypothetical protein
VAKDTRPYKEEGHADPGKRKRRTVQHFDPWQADGWLGDSLLHCRFLDLLVRLGSPSRNNTAAGPGVAGRGPDWVVVGRSSQFWHS